MVNNKRDQKGHKVKNKEIANKKDLFYEIINEKIVNVYDRYYLKTLLDTDSSKITLLRFPRRIAGHIPGIFQGISSRPFGWL